MPPRILREMALSVLDEIKASRQSDQPGVARRDRTGHAQGEIQGSGQIGGERFASPILATLIDPVDAGHEGTRNYGLNGAPCPAGATVRRNAQG
jgi:hypothetical protein